MIDEGKFLSIIIGFATIAFCTFLLSVSKCTRDRDIKKLESFNKCVEVSKDALLCGCGLGKLGL